MDANRRIKLNVPHFIQPTRLDCGPTCIKMLLSFFRFEISLEKIKKHSLKNKKINPPQLAFIIQKILPPSTELKVNFFFFNFQYFDETFNCLNKKEKLSYISHLRPAEKLEEVIKSLKKLINTNSKVRFCLITTELIKKILLKRSPIITLVSVPEFRKIRMDEWRGHYILITGYDYKHFYYNDPHWDPAKSKLHKIEQEHLLVSICKTMFPSLIWIEKNDNQEY